LTAAIVGLRKPEQVKGTAGALEFRLDEKEIAEIESFFKEAASA
jgi:aryl-alcohol dehydrogenase-like predicted oxidoreductase